MKNVRFVLASGACVVAILGLLSSCGLFQKDQPAIGYVLIDTLSPELYREFHIADAINIPYALDDGNLNPAYKDLKIFKQVVEDKTGGALAKETKLFFYCADEMCTSSKSAADIVSSWGYDAMEYDSGLKGWFALSLYGQNKDLYKLEPIFEPGTTFKHHTYLNPVVDKKPDDATLDKWFDDAQPLVGVIKNS